VKPRPTILKFRDSMWVMLNSGVYYALFGSAILEIRLPDRCFAEIKENAKNRLRDGTFSIEMTVLALNNQNCLTNLSL
jgi:hypothetical protein